jgi:hypothetical protein
MNVKGYEIRPGANLQGANLSGTDLWRTDLSWANLQGANLSGTDLRGANLQGTDLSGTDLWGANLRGANLRGANLQGANLQGPDLRGTDLREANLDYTVINLRCSGTNWKADEKQAKQIMLHALELSIDYFPGGLTEKQVTWLMSGHRADEDCFQKFFEKVSRKEEK